MYQQAYIRVQLLQFGECGGNLSFIPFRAGFLDLDRGIVLRHSANSDKERELVTL
jgi:hypothetical protein